MTEPGPPRVTSKNLEPRLRGYARWLPEDWRIVVMVDRDDCHSFLAAVAEAVP